MLRNNRGMVWNWVILAGCLGSTAGFCLERAAAAQPTYYVARGPLPKSKAPAPAEPEGTVPKDTVLGEDHEKNIQALQHEKLDVVRQRVELLTRAAAAGQATQNQVDQATLEELRLELEIQDRPHLRVIALKQIITILQHFEDDAKSHATYPAKPNDINAMISAHGKYVSARLARIGAQISLEKEKLAIEQDAAGKAEKPK